MDLALWIAKSGLEAHHKNIGIISNNLANANTTGFKKNRPEFEDLPYQIITQPGSATSETTNSASGVVLGTGVKLADNKKIFSQGNQIQTDGSLDISIEGRGFLQVQIPNETDLAYTRAGALEVNDQGQVILPNGYIIQPPIVIPPNVQKIHISDDGVVSVTIAGNVTEDIGQIQLADFINPAGLLPVGTNLYKQTVASGTPTVSNPDIDGYGKVKQGTLESSNVNIVEEMVNLIEAQRTFEVTSKAVSAIDSMLQNITERT
jgi:flagellar basal-body rod protein FlgG